MSSVLTPGKITPKAVEALRERIGFPLRSRNTFNTSSVSDVVRHWAHGIGDGNPLWADRDHGSKSPLGTNIAPPSFLYSVSMGVVQMGLAGVHGFQAGSDWTFYQPIPHDRGIDFVVWLDDVVERPSRMGQRSVVTYYSTVYYDREDRQAYAYLRSYSFRIERVGSREKSSEAPEQRTLKTWTEAELEDIEARYLAEQPRGVEPRYAEDVAVGDELPPVHKGPLCLSDMISYYSGGQTLPAPAHGLAVKDKQRHPAWWFRHPESGGLEASVRVHEDVRAALAAGVPAPYDIGVQRNAWLIHLLTDWMGDAGFLVTCDAQYRAFNFFGDFHTFGGTVTRCYQQDGEHRVDVEVWGRNQEGTVTIPGTATIALPSRVDDVSPAARRMQSSLTVDEVLRDLPNAPSIA